MNLMSVKLIDDQIQLTLIREGLFPLDKALCSVKWFKGVMGDKEYPCFVYDPCSKSLFRRNGDLNKQVVCKLINKFGGVLK